MEGLGTLMKTETLAAKYFFHIRKKTCYHTTKNDYKK